ncbi:MAG: Gfo/Idh/MocA family oxidoreductase [Candidatus Thermoplasmatota archaeon]|nr:Gfo/Idh/MocA family oxidoreductase [Candidatus Thermoplasmatota archaeon]
MNVFLYGAILQPTGKNMDSIRFAVVGYGNIGSRHVKFLKELEGAKITLICDENEDRAREGGEEAGCRFVTSFLDVLGDPEVDVVDICTPSGLHADMSIAAMEAGKNAISEKPMALNLGEADRIIEVQERTKMRYFLVKQNRYNPPVAALKEVLDMGKLGALFLIISDVFWNRKRSYYDDERWRGTLALDGGALFTQSSHFVDLILWVSKRPVRVEATMKNVEHPYIETEDLGAIKVVFEDGSIAVMNYTTATFQKNLEGSITVLGTKGSVKVGGKYLNELSEWNVEGVERPEIPPGGPPNTYKGGYQGSMSNHDKVLQNVIEVLRDGKEAKVSAAEGRLTVEVMQAAHISALEKRPVELPLTGSDLDFDIKNSIPFPKRK